MNRLQKKCVIVSGALHGLLVLVLLFGAALMPSQEPAPFKRITLYALPTDAATSGGSPVVQQAAPPAARPTPPQPAPQPAPQPTPQPVVQRRQEPRPPTPAPVQRVVQRTTPNPRPTPPEPAPAPRPTLNATELTMVRRNTSTTTTQTRRQPQPDTSEADAAAAAAAAAAQAKADAAAAAAAQRRMNQALSSALTSINENTDTSSAVAIAPGIGDGPLMANYRDIVASKYTAAWNPPPGLEDESATVTVSVTIYRDGRVIRHEILKRSGNAGMDQSIQRTLENVTFVEVFPAGSRDTQRTFTIKFNLAAKRMIG